MFDKVSLTLAVINLVMSTAMVRYSEYTLFLYTLIIAIICLFTFSVNKQMIFEESKDATKRKTVK